VTKPPPRHKAFNTLSLLETFAIDAPPFHQPAHLGRAASATVEPNFTGPDWFEAYAARHAADGLEGRLVSQFAFSERWDSWEMHPHGAERVICTQGACTLHQEHADGRTERVTLAANDYPINPAGTWHTADVAPGETCAALFIAPGIGTTHRPR
jgi:hypothetical protein